MIVNNSYFLCKKLNQFVNTDLITVNGYTTYSINRMQIPTRNVLGNDL